MAVDASATSMDNGDAPYRVALSATATNCTQVTCPVWARSVLIRFKQNDTTTDDSGHVSNSGTDGGAISTSRFPVASAEAVRWGLSRVPSAKPIIYLAASTASAYAYLVFSPRSDS